MSAWLVGKGHIDALVQSLITERLIPMEHATITGTMLWLENHKSLNARYGDAIPRVVYTFRGIESPLNDGKIGRLIACYDYQSCEHGGWRTSQSCKLVEALSAKIGERHADLGDRWCDELEEAEGTHYPWGIRDIEEAV